MVPSHRARFDFSFKTIAHHDLVAFAPLCHKARDLQKVIAIISITNDDEFSTSLFNPFAQGMPVALQRGVNDESTMLTSDFNRAVRRAVISDNNFATNACFFEGSSGLVDAKCDGLRLVETRNNSGDVKSLIRHLVSHPSAFEGGSHHQLSGFFRRAPSTDRVVCQVHGVFLLRAHNVWPKPQPRSSDSERKVS